MSVSVIIPYNIDRGYLKYAIESIENQTYPVDLILSKSDKCVSYNINIGVRRSKAEYVKYLGEDDILFPNAIENLVNSIKGFDFVHGNSVLFWENGSEVQFVPKIKHPNLSDMLNYNIIAGGSVLYRMDCFKRFGGFDESLICGEEYEYNMRLLASGCKLNYCDNNIYKYRRHKKQKSLGNISAGYQGKRQIEIQKIKDRF